MTRTLTNRSAAQRPPSSTPQTLSPTSALNSNPLLFLQRFITVLFPRPAVLPTTALFDNPKTAFLSCITLSG